MNNIYIILYIIILIDYNYKIKTSSKYNWIGITTASNNHFKVSINLMFSFFLIHPNNLFIYYDMNLSYINRNKLNKAKNLIYKYLSCKKKSGDKLMKEFNFSLYPSHFKVENYNFKQIMIYDTGVIT